MLTAIYIVFHGLEVLNLYPGIIGGLEPTANLSMWMIDYWVSFATSLDPNDGKGSDRTIPYIYIFGATNTITFQGPKWEQYTAQNQVGVKVVFSIV